MLKLSKRLEVLADSIETGESMADIGTDHAKLPIYLRKQGISQHVILSDCRPGPLAKARENCAIYAPGMEFDIRLGNGLATIDPGEVDVVVVSGMGGLLIVDILGTNLNKTKSIKKLILQPRKDKDLLTKWLICNGFDIIDEKLVREGRYICEVLTVMPLQSDEKTKGLLIGDPEWDYEISPILIRKQDPLLIEFIGRKKKTEEKIIRTLQKGTRTPLKNIRLEEALKRLHYLNESFL